MRDEQLHEGHGDAKDGEILALLKDLPVPPAADGFYGRALGRAVLEGRRRQRRRWIYSGFGAAVAAGLAAWVAIGLLWNVPNPGTPEAHIPGVTIALEQPRTVNLVFSSATPLDDASLTVNLPDGVELAGFPGQRVITWETSLKAGRNLLPLTLIAVSPAGGQLLARLEHDHRDRSFRLQIAVSEDPPGAS
jgi:hypothetical protein